MDTKLAQLAVNELGLKIEELEEQINALSMFTPPSKETKSKEKKVSKPKQEGPKKPRNVSEKGYMAKAKMLYYHEIKNSPEIKALFVEKTAWTEVKKHTDKMFAELSDDFKSIYVNQAKGMKLQDDDEDVIDDLLKALH